MSLFQNSLTFSRVALKTSGGDHDPVRAALDRFTANPPNSRYAAIFHDQIVDAGIPSEAHVPALQEINRRYQPEPAAYFIVKPQHAIAGMEHQALELHAQLGEPVENLLPRVLDVVTHPVDPHPHPSS